MHKKFREPVDRIVGPRERVYKLVEIAVFKNNKKAVFP